MSHCLCRLQNGVMNGQSDTRQSLEMENVQQLILLVLDLFQGNSQVKTTFCSSS